MKRYGYHRTSTREQHLDRGIKVIRLIAAYGRPPCNKEILIRSVKDAVDAAF